MDRHVIWKLCALHLSGRSGPQAGVDKENQLSLGKDTWKISFYHYSGSIDDDFE